MAKTADILLSPQKSPIICPAETALWRECLKKYDYGPEKPENECNAERARFYNCVKNWRSDALNGFKELNSDAVVDRVLFFKDDPYEFARNNFKIPANCRGQAQSLHNCMMINMFEIAKCQRDMAQLKICVAKRVPSIAFTLEEDMENGKLAPWSEKNDPDNATGTLWLWYKLIGKV